MSTEVELATYTHRWSELQVRLMTSVAKHTKTHQYSFLVTQKPGNCHQNMNRIWRRLTAAYVVLMDEDVVILQDGWLASLIESLESDEKIGVVGCAEVKTLPAIVPEPGKVTLDFQMWIPAYVMAFKRERVPFLRFDEAIPGQMGMTDLDACLQIVDKGLKVAVNPQVVVFHPNRDDDAIRVREQRPLIRQQEDWFRLQSAYMNEKWGDLWKRVRRPRGT